MIYLSIGAIMVMIPALLVYYRREKDTMPKKTLRLNMLGIIALIVVMAWCLKIFFIHDDDTSEQNTEITR